MYLGRGVDHFHATRLSTTRNGPRADDLMADRLSWRERAPAVGSQLSTAMTVDMLKREFEDMEA